MSTDEHVDARPDAETDELPVDPEALRAEVRAKYRHVAEEPQGEHHFHTGRKLARHLGYPAAWTDDLPEPAVESFAGIANPFALRELAPASGWSTSVRRRVRQLRRRPAGRPRGAGGRGRHDRGDAREVAPQRRRARPRPRRVPRGLAEELPVEDGWADVVISNGVINLCPDKKAVFTEIHRVLRPGGRLQFADIANGNTVPPGAMREIDLWTG
jgi:arsenite methyltransferase